MSKTNGNTKGAVDKRPRALFSPGAITLSIPVRGAILRGEMEIIELSEFLAKHLKGDWGNVPEAHRRLNDAALESGARLLSAYQANSGKMVTLVTDPVSYDGFRLLTTFKLPFEL